MWPRPNLSPSASAPCTAHTSASSAGQQGPPLRSYPSSCLRTGHPETAHHHTPEVFKHDDPTPGPWQAARWRPQGGGAPGSFSPNPIAACFLWASMSEALTDTDSVDKPGGVAQASPAPPHPGWGANPSFSQAQPGPWAVRFPTLCLSAEGQWDAAGLHPPRALGRCRPTPF